MHEHTVRQTRGLWKNERNLFLNNFIHRMKGRCICIRNDTNIKFTKPTPDPRISQFQVFCDVRQDKPSAMYATNWAIPSRSDSFLCILYLQHSLLTVWPYYNQWRFMQNIVFHLLCTTLYTLNAHNLYPILTLPLLFSWMLRPRYSCRGEANVYMSYCNDFCTLDALKQSLLLWMAAFAGWTEASLLSSSRFYGG